MTEMKRKSVDALSVLPSNIRGDVIKTITSVGIDPDELTDIRLRREGDSYISAGPRSYKLCGTMTPRRFDDAVFAMTGGSLYAHADTIRDGYINVGGIRCGVCGRANMHGELLAEVCDISSLSIRVRREVPGAADSVYELLTRESVMRGVLVYSPPGVGKTTLLCDLIRRLSRDGVQIAVVDCRGELASACRDSSADLLSGYPKHVGIRSAVRSLSPQLIICDELAGADDANAAIYAKSCGVPIVATSHADSVSDLNLRPELAHLCSSHVFSYLVGLKRDSGSVRSIITAT